MGWFRGCQVQGIDWGCKRWQKLPSFSEERQSLWKNCVILAITKNACRLFAYLHHYLHPHHPCHHHQEQQHQHQHSNPLNVTKSRAGAAGWLCYWLCLYAFLCVVVCAVGRLRVSRCPQSRSWWDTFWAPLLHPAYNDYIMYIIYYISYINII